MSEIENIPFGLSPEDVRRIQIFQPYLFERTMTARNVNQRFVHYTNADTALRIFRNREVWLRKSSCMNDFMEIEHGLNCLNAAMQAHGDAIKSLFNGMFPGFHEKLIGLLNEWLPKFRSETYITCMSEHDVDEDRIGRLSMWRAYGGAAGVAVVMNGAPFLSPTEALKAYTSPVSYIYVATYPSVFEKFVKDVQENAEFVRSLGEEIVFNNVFEAFRSTLVCTKHPGFLEEREWRVIYSPALQTSPRVRREIESIAGVPQPVAKIPLVDVPTEGLVGIEIPALIERVIIGPTQYPAVIWEAFVAELHAAGVPDAEKKVIVSDIPLRN